MSNGRNIKAVLFDFDGTLTVPGLIDFLAIKAKIGCPENSTILEFIFGLASAPARKKALTVLEKYEEQAAAAARPNENAEDLIAHLKKLKLKLGILTRNSLRSVRKALDSFARTTLADFEVVISREQVQKLKPHPEGVLLACRRFKISPAELVVVGDYIFDIEAGQRAGAVTVFIESGHTTRRPDPPADFTIKRLDELKDIFKGLAG